MKNQTKNTNKIGENTITRNFFQKAIILLAVFALTSLTNNVKAQTNCINYDWVNNSGCDWSIMFSDDFGNNIALSAVTAAAASSGTVPSSGCFACYSAMGSGNITFTNASGCTFTIPVSGGTVTGVSTTCTSRLQTLSCGGTPFTSSISVTTNKSAAIPCDWKTTITIN